MRFKFSKPVTKEELEVAYSQGLIRLRDLKDYTVYLGECRNSNQAMWSASLKMFIYVDCEFFETIEHPENDDGFDLFLATQESNLPPPEGVGEFIERMVRNETR